MSDLPRARMKVYWHDGLVHLVHGGKRPHAGQVAPDEQPFVTAANARWFCEHEYAPRGIAILKDDVSLTCMMCISREGDDGPRT